MEGVEALKLWHVIPVEKITLMFSKLEEPVYFQV
jgi:hypothetical protein